VDLRQANADDLLPKESVLSGADTTDGAIQMLEHHLGFTEREDIAYLFAPLGPIAAHRTHLAHIVEKRSDVRERTRVASGHLGTW
jgi:hypothetical protein